MEERTDALAGSPAASADHGITIIVTPREADAAFSWPWRASCLCGWQSPAVPTRPHSVADGEAHMAATRNEPNPAVNPNPKEHPTVPEQPQTATALPPCPWWCRSRDVDHKSEYDSAACDDPLKLYRNHSREFAKVAVVQSESNRLGVITLEPVRLAVYFEGENTSAGAEQVAEEIRQAAELMKRIERTDETLTVTTESGTYVVPPCPAWCVLPSDHDLDDMTMREPDGTVNRAHRAGEWTVPSMNADVFRINVGQVTTVGDAGWPEAIESPHILVVANTTTDLIENQARLAAVAFTAAADTLEAVRQTFSAVQHMSTL